MSRASNLAGFTTAIGVPVNLNVGVVTATSFSGDGSNLTGVQVGGSAGIDLNDNVKIRFGTGNDLEIYHNGTDSYISDTATGSLILTGSRVIVKNTADNARMIDAIEGGAVKLLHNNSEKLETTTTGITVTGNVVADGIRVGDDDKINLGDNDDLQISHDGATSIISGMYHPIEIRHQSEVHIKCVDDGTVELYHNNSKKLETTSSGVTVTGNVVVGSGNGIDFSATSDASGMTNELLDDYEEGTFTPTAFLGTTAQTVTTATGTYTKVGNTVFFSCRLEGITKSGTGELSIGGLPYTPLFTGNANKYNQPTVRYTGINPGGVLVPLFSPSGSRFIFFQGISTSGVLGSITDSAASSTYNIYGLSGFYTV